MQTFLETRENTMALVMRNGRFVRPNSTSGLRGALELMATPAKRQTIFTLTTCYGFYRVAIR